MRNERTILITGVTGNQGGAVAQALQGTGFRLRGLTRKPTSSQADTLERQGIDIVKGDLDDEATLRRALTGAWGVFSVQNTAEAGVEREEVQGKRLATLAREAGFQHFVYTSVGSANKRTWRPALRQQVAHRGNHTWSPLSLACDPASGILHGQPASALQSSGQHASLGARRKHEATMIAVDDIGCFGARAFTDARSLNGREIDLAGDVRTLAQAAQILTEALGRPIAFSQTPIEQVRNPRT